MRKLLLASVATLGTVGLMGSAFAQSTTVVTTAPVALPPVPTQGQAAWTPAAAPPAGANNNNNYQAPALPGPVANPTPGTMVVHINGKVEVDGWGLWSSADKRSVTAPAGSPGGPALAAGAATPAATSLGNNGTGTVSVNPQGIGTFARLYAGADAMATNGLRYGAAIEIRENFTGQISGNASSGASGFTSEETLFVRRAFTYVAGENWGIFRVGQADGIIGIFDNGVTTFQFLPTGNLNGGDLQTFPSNVSPTFVFMGQAGNEYGNSKAVYLSPQIAGFDFGLQYAPNTANAFGEGGNTENGLASSNIGAGTGTGLTCSCGEHGLSATVVWPRLSGRLAGGQPGRGRRSLPRRVWPGWRAGLWRLHGQWPCDLYRLCLQHGSGRCQPRQRDDRRNRSQVHRQLQWPEPGQRWLGGDRGRVHRRRQRDLWT